MSETDSEQADRDMRMCIERLRLEVVALEAKLRVLDSKTSKQALDVLKQLDEAIKKIVTVDANSD